MRSWRARAGRSWRAGAVVTLSALTLACSRSHAPTAELAGNPAESEPLPAAAEAAPAHGQAPAVAQAPTASPESPRAPAAEPATANDCNDKIESNLPGASIRVTTKVCSYSAATLSKGVEVAYEVRFDRAVRGVRPYHRDDRALVPWPRWAAGHSSGCYKPGDASNVHVAYWIEDGKPYMPPIRTPEDALQPTMRLWCPQCEGWCVPQTVPAAAVDAGVYPQTTRAWKGDDKLHASPFPPGEYTLTLRTDGSYVPDGASEPQPFHMQTTRRISITP